MSTRKWGSTIAYPSENGWSHTRVRTGGRILFCLFYFYFTTNIVTFEFVVLCYEKKEGAWTHFGF